MCQNAQNKLHMVGGLNVDFVKSLIESKNTGYRPGKLACVLLMQHG